MFSYIERLGEGDKLCFSAGQTGCPGASCYLGFSTSSKDGGRFLSENFILAHHGPSSASSVQSFQNWSDCRSFLGHHLLRNTL
jgi:hypothetical protein